MKSIQAVSLLVVIAFGAQCVLSSPFGAPAIACEDMTPNHEGNVTQTSVPPYSVSVSANTVVQEGTLDITVTADAATTFKGFFVQGREAANKTLLYGYFISDEYKVISCLNGLQNAITHPSNSNKTEVSFQWVAPNDYTGDIVFKATVVQQFDTFWTGLESDVVTVTA